MEMWNQPLHETLTKKEIKSVGRPLNINTICSRKIKKVAVPRSIDEIRYDKVNRFLQFTTRSR